MGNVSADGPYDRSFEVASAPDPAPPAEPKPFSGKEVSDGEDEEDELRD